MTSAFKRSAPLLHWHCVAMVSSDSVPFSESVRFPGEFFGFSCSLGLWAGYHADRVGLGFLVDTMWAEAQVG